MRRISRCGRRGAAVVELAIVAPILLMIVFGVVEFGRAMMVSHVLTTVARNGARKAILDDATNANVSDLVKNRCSEMLNVDSASVGVTISIEPGPENADPGNSLNNSNRGDQCTVTVTLPFNEVTLIPAAYLSGSIFSAECTMEHE